MSLSRLKDFLWTILSRLMVAGLSLIIIYVSKLESPEFSAIVSCFIALGYSLSVLDGGEIFRLRRAILAKEKLLFSYVTVILFQVLGATLILYFYHAYHNNFNIKFLIFEPVAILIYLSTTIYTQQLIVTIGKASLKIYIIYNSIFTIACVFLYYYMALYGFIYTLLCGCIMNFIILYKIILYEKVKINSKYKFSVDHFNSIGLFISNLIFCIMPLLALKNGAYSAVEYLVIGRMVAGYVSGFIQMIFIRNMFFNKININLNIFYPVICGFLSMTVPIIITRLLNDSNYNTNIIYQAYIFGYAFLQSFFTIKFIYYQYISATPFIILTSFLQLFFVFIYLYKFNPSPETYLFFEIFIIIMTIFLNRFIVGFGKDLSLEQFK